MKLFTPLFIFILLTNSSYSYTMDSDISSNNASEQNADNVQDPFITPEIWNAVTLNEYLNQWNLREKKAIDELNKRLGPVLEKNIKLLRIFRTRIKRMQQPPMRLSATNPQSLSFKRKPDLSVEELADLAFLHIKEQNNQEEQLRLPNDHARSNNRFLPKPDLRAFIDKA